MIPFIKTHIQFAIMLALWAVVGLYMKPLHLAIIPACVLLLKRKNMYVELICGFFFVLTLSDSWSMEMKWANDVKDIYMIMLCLFVLFDKKSFSYKNDLFYPFIPFFAVALGVMYRSPEFMTCFQKTLSFILIYTLIPFYYQKLIHEEQERFFKGIAYTMTALLLYGFLMILINYNTAYLAGRFRGLMGNPNGLGILCTVMFPFMIIVTDKYKNLFSRNDLIVIFGAIVLSAILSGSRNTVLSMFIFYAFSRFFKVSYFLGFTIIIVLAVSYQLIMANFASIVTALGLQEYMRVDKFEEGSGRIVAWMFAWKNIQDNFMLGRGFNYESWLFLSNAPYLRTLGHIGNSHNSWLATWLNTGIIGLVLFLFALIYRFVKGASNSVYSLPLMYAILFSATFEAWLTGSLNVFISLLLLMWTLFNLKTENSPVKNPMPAPESSGVHPVLS